MNLTAHCVFYFLLSAPTASRGTRSLPAAPTQPSCTTTRAPTSTTRSDSVPSILTGVPTANYKMWSKTFAQAGWAFFKPIRIFARYWNVWAAWDNPINLPEDRAVNSLIPQHSLRLELSERTRGAGGQWGPYGCGIMGIRILSRFNITCLSSYGGVSPKMTPWSRICSCIKCKSRRACLAVTIACKFLIRLTPNFSKTANLKNWLQLRIQSLLLPRSRVFPPAPAVFCIVFHFLS